MTASLVYELSTSQTRKPENPFETLPVATQNAILNAIDEGNAAYHFKDYNGALHYYSQAHTLHPFNPQAMEGLDKIVALVKAQQHGGNREQHLNKLKTVQVLLQHDILAEREDLKKLEALLQKLAAE